jgi:hypothetical protein
MLIFVVGEIRFRYAKKHGYPHLEHVTLPRMGAMQVILNELSPESCKQQNALNGGE